MSTTRISGTDSGMRLTLVRMRSSSSRASARGRKLTSIGRSAASSAFTSSSIRGPKPSGSGSNSKSIRADRGSMFPPVTGTPHSFQITPHSTWRAVWVRIEARGGAPSRPRPAPACPRPATSPSQAVPHHLALLADLHDRGRARRPGQPAGVVGLAAAGGVEGGPVEGDPAVLVRRSRWRRRPAARRLGGRAGRWPPRQSAAARTARSLHGKPRAVGSPVASSQSRAKPTSRPRTSPCSRLRRRHRVAGRHRRPVDRSARPQRQGRLPRRRRG